MILSRRHFAHLIWGSLGAAGLAGVSPALGREAPPDLPNVFFSPHGKPFRAKPGEPYPVAAWFAGANKAGDGKLTHAEFIADAAAFFTELDMNKDDQLDPYEISLYEHRVAPEILGFRVNLATGGPVFHGISQDGAVLWQAQMPGGQGGPGSPQLGPVDGGSVDPGGDKPNEPSRRDPNADMGTGAAPYSLLNESEPITSADADFLFRGAVRKDRFLRHADDHFTTLDTAEAGFLTLAGLPKTPLQKMIERGRRGGVMAVRIGK